MADGKKDYVVEKRINTLTVRMLDKGVDGLYHSATCEYPYYDRVIGADGNYVGKRLTKKQTEKMLLKTLVGYYK